MIKSSEEMAKPARGNASDPCGHRVVLGRVTAGGERENVPVRGAILGGGETVGDDVVEAI